MQDIIILILETFTSCMLTKINSMGGPLHYFCLEINLNEP
jgi:hypothetical protein